MKVNLLITQGKNKGKELPVGIFPFFIGRDAQCNLRPSHRMISRRHCAFMSREGRYFLRDLGSTNGTYINGERIQGEYELRHGDLLKLDPFVFVVRIEKTVPVNKPTPLPPSMKTQYELADDPDVAVLFQQLQKDLKTPIKLPDVNKALGKTYQELPALPPKAGFPKSDKKQV